jgi:hypothetical protein
MVLRPCFLFFKPKSWILLIVLGSMFLLLFEAPRLDPLTYTYIMLFVECLVLVILRFSQSEGAASAMGIMY